jgi:hypothetical protein
MYRRGHWQGLIGTAGSRSDQKLLSKKVPLQRSFEFTVSFMRRLVCVAT